MAVPNIFGSATSAIPLSQLDTNFATAITLGNTAVYLGNTTTSLGNVTLTNVTVSSGNVTVTGANVSGNLTFTGTGNRITGDFSNATVANRVMFQTSTTNGNTVINLIPNGTGTACAFGMDTDPTLTNSSTGAFNLVASTDVRLSAGIRGTGSYLPMTFYTGGSERMRVDTSGNVGIGTSSPSSPLNVVSASSSLAIAINGRSSDSLGAMYFYANNGSTQHATITTSATEFRLSSVPAAAVQTFYTNGSERMRIDSSGNLQFNSGYGSVATAYGCRAWVNFDGTGVVAIRASGNVSSITDAGVGLYDVNFTTALTDANYAISATAYSANSSLYAIGGQTNGQAPTTAKFRIAIGAGASFGSDTTAGYADLPYIFASVFR